MIYLRINSIPSLIILVEKMSPERSSPLRETVCYLTEIITLTFPLLVIVSLLKFGTAVNIGLLR